VARTLERRWDEALRAVQQLEALGVEVRTGQLVTAVTNEGVIAGGGWLVAKTVLWAAGVVASPLAATLGVPLDRAGRVAVAPDLSLPGHQEVFVIGDLALFLHQTGLPLPGESAGIVPGVKDYSGSSIGNLPSERCRSVSDNSQASAASLIGRVDTPLDCKGNRS